MNSRKELFEAWANSYDKSILESQNSFPFKGYSELISEILNLIKPNSTVLDLGIGTGFIANSIHSKLNAQIYGIDLSDKMIEIAKNRIPDSVIVHLDFNNYKSFNWNVFPNKIDYIIGTYFFHHFEDDKKVEIIEFLLNQVSPNAKIIIGDIGFLNFELFEINQSNPNNSWDETEYYFNLETFEQALKNKQLKVNSNVISEHCVILEIWK